MLHFSHIHNFQEREAIKQVLVFVTPKKCLDFNNYFLQTGKADKYGVIYSTVENFDDRSTDAVFKIRAVLNGSGQWTPILRGMDGKPLHVLSEEYKNYFEALDVGVAYVTQV